MITKITYESSSAELSQQASVFISILLKASSNVSIIDRSVAATESIFPAFFKFFPKGNVDNLFD